MSITLVDVSDFGIAVCDIKKRDIRLSIIYFVNVYLFIINVYYCQCPIIQMVRGDLKRCIYGNYYG